MFLLFITNINIIITLLVYMYFKGNLIWFIDLLNIVCYNILIVLKKQLLLNKKSQKPFSAHQGTPWQFTSISFADVDDFG